MDALNKVWRLARVPMLALSVGAATMMASPAVAQPGGPGGGRGGGMREMFTLPPITSRQMEKYGEMLGLSEDQKTAAEALFDGYSEAVRENNEAVREKMEKVREEFRESRDPAVWEGLQDSMRASRDARKKIEESFAADIKLILTPEQVERWPAVERAQRRDQTLRRGFLSGERVDLFSLVEEAKLPEDVAAAVKPVLDQYDIDMDRELTRRNETYETSFEKMGELRREGDMEGLQDLIKDGREAGARVRDLNRRFARQITDLLPEDQKPAFELAFKRASFPEVYRPSQVSRSITAAVGFADITEDQKAQLSALEARYTRDADGVNEKLAKGIEENEMNFDMANFMNRDREEGPLAELRRERRDMDRAAMDELRKILTAEQQERLPKPENDGQRRDRNRGDRRGPGEEQT